MKNHPYNEFERRLLRSASEDRPSVGSQARVVAALGVGTAVSSVTSTAAGTTAAEATKVATVSLTATTGTAARGALLKWLGLAIVSGAIVTGGVATVRQHDPTVVDSAPSASVLRTPSVPVASVLATPPQAAPVESAATEAPRPSPPLAASPHPSARPAISEQVEALDDVRTSLAGGHASDALRRLGAFERRFPGSPLREEVSVLRIEALVMAGDVESARQQASQFAAQYPNSAYGRHVQTLVAK